jgi:hypothetical protein
VVASVGRDGQICQPAREYSKPIGLLIVITGALGLVAAGVTLRMVSAEPKSERLTVSAVTPAGPGNLGGTPVANQVKAYVPEGMNQGAGDRVMVLSDSRASLTNGSLLRALFTIAPSPWVSPHPPWASAFCSTGRSWPAEGLSQAVRAGSASSS